MPDKEGSDDEKKSTKSVVNKKQKQMMGEEGYDIARDMGRVRPSKDKKDATTMPPSKEMEKTRKVNKGPSALERVKKKYKGQIMDVKKEELDLTQVAEAFGGFIVEAPKKPKKYKQGSFEYSKELGPEGKFQTSNIVKRMMQAFPPPGTGGKIGSVDKIDVEAEKRLVQQSLPGMEGGGERTRKKRSDAGKSRDRYRRKAFAAPGQLQLDLTNPKDREQIQQDVVKAVKQPKKTAGAVLQRTFLTPDKGVRGLLKNIRQNPVTTAIAAGIARDSVRNPMPQIQMPTVKGGKVGKRTAG